MTRTYIINKLKELKPKYEKEGLILLGLFGSYAKNEATNNSDIDLLYDINSSKFFNNTSNWGEFNKINIIKNELKEIFKKDIDLCSISGNSRTFKKFALKDAIYV